MIFDLKSEDKNFNVRIDIKNNYLELWKLDKIQNEDYPTYTVMLEYEFDSGFFHRGKE
jgi:hypothetical protein